MTDMETCSLCTTEVPEVTLSEMVTGERVCEDCWDQVPECEDCFGRTWDVDENRHMEILCPVCWRW